MYPSLRPLYLATQCYRHGSRLDSLPQRALNVLYRPYSSASLGIKEVISLSYEVLEPAKPSDNGYDAHAEPILFLHGFLGSRKNNRSISK